jgi:hypothetical protein
MTESEAKRCALSAFSSAYAEGAKLIAIEVAEIREVHLRAIALVGNVENAALAAAMRLLHVSRDSI